MKIRQLNMFLLKVLPMFYPQKIKNAVTYSVTTFCEKLYALCLVVPPAPQIRLIIRLLQDLHPEIHPKIKSDSLIIILYIKHYLQVLNNLTIMMPCGILLYFLLFCLFLSNKYVTLKYHFGLDWN